MPAVQEKVKEILNIPQKYKVVAMSPFGYPKDKKSLYSSAVSIFAGSKKRLPKPTSSLYVCYKD